VNAGTTRAVRPAQLPADLATFAGRRAEVARVSALLEEPAAGAMLIDGMPGAGKTTLAVHWARLVADRFPDGQLYVNLRGFDPGGTLGPAEALSGFLPALGVAPQQVPADLDGRARLYRSLLAGQRVLVVLDNARDEAQVRPLLPGAPGSMVIVTSRNRLTGLVASDGASLLTLDVFSPADAREALTRRLGAARAAEPAAVEEIIARSGRLPLALALVAARAAAHPQFPLAAIAGELRDAQGSLDAFAGEGGTDVRVIFSWSYRMLSPLAARLFRLLSRQAGPEISLAAAASLAARPARPTRALLAELTRARLLTEYSPGRYSLHDLLRSYAAELCAETDPASHRDAATARLLGHYLHSARHQPPAAPAAPASPGAGIAGGRRSAGAARRLCCRAGLVHHRAPRTRGRGQVRGPPRSGPLRLAARLRDDAVLPSAAVSGTTGRRPPGSAWTRPGPVMTWPGRRACTASWPARGSTWATARPPWPSWNAPAACSPGSTCPPNRPTCTATSAACSAASAATRRR